MSEISYSYSELELKFWPRVLIDDGCWKWTGNTMGNGYGVIWVGDRTIGAHRCAYQLWHKVHLEDQHVLHKCDNPICVRPDHLFLGTHKINLQDASNKGRMHQGESHGNSKLTNEQVLAIRASTRGSKDLSIIYGVNQNTINKIKRREQWKHI